VELGLDVNPGEGFLHRKRWNPEGLRLILDLIDPFKFVDREKLLEAVLDVSVNWEGLLQLDRQAWGAFLLSETGGRRCVGSRRRCC